MFTFVSIVIILFCFVLYSFQLLTSWQLHNTSTRWRKYINSENKSRNETAMKITNHSLHATIATNNSHAKLMRTKLFIIITVLFNVILMHIIISLLSDSKRIKRCVG